MSSTDRVLRSWMGVVEAVVVDGCGVDGKGDGPGELLYSKAAGDTL